MEELQLFLEVCKKYGFVKVLTIVTALNASLMLIDKIRHFWRKYVTKSFVSFGEVETLRDENKKMKKEITEIRRDMNTQMEKQGAHAIAMDSLQARQNQVEATSQSANYLMQKIDQSLARNNKLLDEVKQFVKRPDA